jgi:hypothetical protein
MTLKLWLEHLGLEFPAASTLSDNLNAVSNQTRSLIHQAQLRYIFQGGLDAFQKRFVALTSGPTFVTLRAWDARFRLQTPGQRPGRPKAISYQLF